MTWTAPRTWVANQALTAAMLNEQLRDNFLALDVAQCLTQGSIIGVDGPNALSERVPGIAASALTENTASTVYVSLTPCAATVTIGASGSALVMSVSLLQTNTAGAQVHASFAVSGASTVAAADSREIRIDGLAANRPTRIGDFFLMTGLTAGSNTFTQQYRVSAGTCTVGNRRLVVWPQ